MSHLVFVRHGESELNVTNRDGRIFCGQTNTPLTDFGRQQASDVGDALAARAELRIERAVSSALSRCRDTLDLILRRMPNGVECLPDSSALNERSLGKFEGRNAEDVYAEFPEYRDDPKFNQFQYNFTQKAPEGENLKEVTDRAWPVVRELEKACAGDILIVSHFTTIRCMVGKALELSEQRTLRLKVANAVPVILERGETHRLLEGLSLPDA
ncbi:MAG: histidine phosphatase family protein [Planctomycetes bacterium]|nr:histidine phosphatase family protein [Planctomycetota bacterium]MBL7038649.1 histidine phosphatase family protein [Pirellulaceae bacterium]